MKNFNCSETLVYHFEFGPEKLRSSLSILNLYVLFSECLGCILNGAELNSLLCMQGLHL